MGEWGKDNGEVRPRPRGRPHAFLMRCGHYFYTRNTRPLETDSVWCYRCEEYSRLDLPPLWRYECVDCGVKYSDRRESQVRRLGNTHVVKRSHMAIVYKGQTVVDTVDARQASLISPDLLAEVDAERVRKREWARERRAKAQSDSMDEIRRMVDGRRGTNAPARDRQARRKAPPPPRPSEAPQTQDQHGEVRSDGDFPF